MVHRWMLSWFLRLLFTTGEKSAYSLLWFDNGKNHYEFNFIWRNKPVTVYNCQMTLADIILITVVTCAWYYAKYIAFEWHYYSAFKKKRLHTCISRKVIKKMI